MKLFPLNPSCDPLGGRPSIQVDETMSPTVTASSFKLAPLADWIPAAAPLPTGDRDSFAGLGDRPVPDSVRSLEIKLTPLTEDRPAPWDAPCEASPYPREIKLAPATKSDYAGLGDPPSEPEAFFRKGATNRYPEEPTEGRGGQIIEREILYRSRSGFMVTKRVVVSDQGRELTVVSCPGCLAVL